MIITAFVFHSWQQNTYHHGLPSWTKIKKLTASTFVADKANLRQAAMVAADAEEDLVCAWWHGVVFPPPMPFMIKVGSEGFFFKGGDNMIIGEMPGIMVLS